MSSDQTTPKVLLAGDSTSSGYGSFVQETTPVIDERHTAARAVAMQIMLKHNVPLNDLHRVMEDAGKETCIRLDRVHMTEARYALLPKRLQSCSPP